jgi:ABC-type ATPase with predicted acetyltransferase domain
MEIDFSIHARGMMAERGIPEEWIRRCLKSPDSKEAGADGNDHYLKAIEEHGSRVLRVIVNPHRQPVVW